MISEDPVHLVHLPLLDVGGVGIRQIKQTLGKVAHHRVPVQKLLVVEPLREQLLSGGTADQRTLVGKDQLFLLKQGSGFFQNSGFPHLFQI